MIPSEINKQSANSEKFKKLGKQLESALNEVETMRKQQNELVTHVEKLVSSVERQNSIRKEILKRANFNPISGLPNHNLLDSNLMSFFDSGKGDSKPGALVLLQLDNNFDMISKTQESLIGSWLVYRTGLRLRKYIGKNGSVYHIRDEKFLLHIFKANTATEFAPFLIKIDRQISKPYIFASQHIVIGCVIGATLYPTDGNNKNALLNNADIALSEARRKNRNYAFFEPKMLDDAVRMMKTRSSMIQALEKNAVDKISKQLYLNLQPIVSISQIKKNKPIIENINAEALIRWRHPIEGNVPPDAFIPIAEETGVIIVIGKWVLYKAAAQIEVWEWQQIKSKLAINVSPRQFHNDDLIDSIRRIIKNRRINPEKLQIEITENSFLDDPYDATKKISRLKDLGISVAIDDFGTGFSSINYLKQLPVDAVKIDRSFVEDLTTSANGYSIVKAIIALTQELGMTNIAEGVETWEQLELLMQLGISTFQGFLFSKALSPDDYAEFYRRYKEY
ncbi:diguanylate cyclase/phosphodiesterase (GGDEF & EAL domains) with PAS/PAC sensor(s) [Olavius algarvensis spirochete endosymbiont]|uniref:putative bifunctional diguanylate cyclase/phosphodiesterase n=1 Tax=Olavius algarvensis spirochete endosymbiont TaxID=260710 RepID=UPI000F129FFC|nr:bifunctional diguanylate cyclase/phosphodiesterase [Olavius algarvensis spirochete endosymbiont]VDB01064.1 diguanylate cyclase/phosphodiesterase (GGDEF & EAL domains) with PAS/PAC sensor(s) [Olavius algarvensis spirochete endosymbiont]